MSLVACIQEQTRMLKKQKNPTFQQAAKMRDWNEESRTGPISEYFPDVQSIEIKAHYTPEMTWHGEPGDKVRSYTPTSKAYFKMDCPWEDCVAGGLDLASQVRTMIREKVELKSDRTFCDGWQDESRVGRHKCLLDWSYSVSIRYKN
jgi:hypothetical protein